MTDVDLTKAAQRAREVLPEPIGSLVRARIKYGLDEKTMREFADAVMSIPAPAPAVDRDRLAAVLHDLSYGGKQLPPGHCRALADFVLSRGVVTTGQRDGGEQDG